MLLKKIAGPCSAALLSAVIATAAPQDAAAQTKLRIANSQVYTSFAIADYAKEKGIFARNGLDVEITRYRGGGPAQEAVAAGAADAMPNAPFLAALAASKGVKQKIVAQSGSNTPEGWVVAVPKATGITSVKELAGRKVGVSAKASTTDFLLQAILSDAKITATAVPLGGGILAALKNNQIEGGILSPILSFKAAEDPDLRVIYDLGQLNGLAINTWTFTDTYIAANRKAVAAFVKSMRESLKDMKQNRAAAVAFLMKYHDETDQKMIQTAYEKMILTMPDDLALDREAVSRTLVMAKLAGVDSPVGVDEIFTDEFLKQ